jgi:hypothetical protein
VGQLVEVPEWILYKAKGPRRQGKARYIYLGGTKALFGALRSRKRRLGHCRLKLTKMTDGIAESGMTNREGKRD